VDHRGSRQAAQVARPGAPRVLQGVAFRTGPGPRTATDSQPSYNTLGPHAFGIGCWLLPPSKRGPTASFIDCSLWHWMTCGLLLFLAPPVIGFRGEPLEY